MYATNVLILHGDNPVVSRNRLVAVLNQAKTQEKDIVRLTAKGLTLEQLQQALRQESLFHTSSLVIIEELHSLPRSKQKDQLIETVAAAEGEIVLWENKTLTPTQLKKFPKAKVELSKLSKSVFAWADALGTQLPLPKQLHLLESALEQDEAELCFAMLIRQIRLLIQAKEKQLPPTLRPFQTSKLQSQVSYFSLLELRQLHKQLLTIDLNQKTSQNLLPLAATLDLFTIEVYSHKLSVKL